MIIGTKQEFENLADYVLRDYLGSEYESSYSPFNVTAFAEEYLKLEISFFDFNPEENIEGMRTGNKIILDSRLCEPARVGERNFTVAHECGHEIINWQDPTYVPYQITNYRIKKQHKELKTENDFKARDQFANLQSGSLGFLINVRSDVQTYGFVTQKGCLRGRKTPQIALKNRKRT